MSRRSPCIQNASLHHGTSVSCQPACVSSFCMCFVVVFRGFILIARRRYLLLHSMNVW